MVDLNEVPALSSHGACCCMTPFIRNPTICKLYHVASGSLGEQPLGIIIMVFSPTDK